MEERRVGSHQAEDQYQSPRSTGEDYRSGSGANRKPTQSFEISHASPYTEYQRGGVSRNPDHFNNLRSENCVPMYSNQSSPRHRPVPKHGKTPKFGVCLCLACGPMMAGAALFITLLLLVAYLYSEFVLGGVFSNSTTQAVVSPRDPVDQAIAADAAMAFAVYSGAAGLVVLLDVAIACTSCCQSSAPVVEAGRKAAGGVAAVATFAGLVDLGILGLGSYCTLLIYRIEGIPPMDTSNYEWGATVGIALAVGSGVSLLLHIVCSIMVGKHGREIQHEYNAHSYLTHIATEGQTARTD
eukprot:INCI6701.2.p1 GENE.INCI6701.2~~INCI6701.2.p1  ORF type:complete len:297 (-),score=27.82 INCI6701.2:258-1148(-)